MSDHGRIISLASGSNDSDHWIEAYAGFPAELDEPTLQNAVQARVDWIRERSSEGSVSVLRSSDVLIGGDKGKRAVVRYHDKESNRIMVEDFVEVLRSLPAAAVEYSLYLRAPNEAYDRDKIIFDKVLSSFALTGCDQCS